MPQNGQEARVARLEQDVGWMKAEMGELKETIKEMSCKIDGLNTRLVAAAVSFAMATLVLLLNIITGALTP